MTLKKLLLPLLCLLLLAGCGEKNNNTLELTTPDGSVTGSYAGEELDGLPQGQGVFTSENGWVYEGSFAAGVFEQGSVTAYPAPAFNGSYTGAVEDLVPQGEGRLVWEGGSFSGTFDRGAPVSGSAENFPCRVSFGDTDVEGLYTGTLSAGLPEGEGSFTADAGRELYYEGGFAAGCAAGEGSLSDDGYMLAGQRGRYEGSVLDGLPSGEGVFHGRSAENIDFTYQGQWKDGLYDGMGELLYDSELYYERVGHFTQGEFTPDAAERMAALGSREPCFEISDATWKYISGFPELLDAGRTVPDYMQADYRFLWDMNLNYLKYTEDPAQYPESWLLFFNYIILRSYEVDVFGEDNRCTVILASNTLYKEPVVFYLFGNAGNLTSMTYLSGYGIPMGMTHYTNANGEKQEAVAVLLGSAGGY
ncbi:MAG: hypothetical protein E7442_05985 [Ruminococcaceae bacterium]|nr:hypothetical protein [Oscillospiraceae bacterium]